VETLKVADIGLDAAQVGWPGSRQEIVDVRAAEARQAGEIIEDDGSGAERVVAYLESLKVI
jgi:electron transfer flavoprotein beta subunit